tara:strand:- start:437 stop:790 length:354 start_codon:yes stop_codon:yes gene_type:complete
MAAIQKEITVGFKGERYDVKLSMDLINRIELKGVNLLKLQMLVEQDTIPPTSLLSSFYALLLQSAGVDVSAEDVWGELITADPIGLINASKTALSAMFPSSNEDALSKKPKPKAAKG